MLEDYLPQMMVEVVSPFLLKDRTCPRISGRPILAVDFAFRHSHVQTQSPRNC